MCKEQRKSRSKGKLTPIVLLHGSILQARCNTEGGTFLQQGSSIASVSRLPLMAHFRASGTSAMFSCAVSFVSLHPPIHSHIHRQIG